jgi:carbon dioxide concentrating mechanism protein CcmO
MRDRDDPYVDSALGLISVQSFPAIVGVADNMLKASSVALVGYEQIGAGYCTAVVRGGISDVRLAIQTGEEIAAQFGQKVSSLVIARPMPNLDEILPIGSKLAGLIAGREHNRFRDHAVGLIETIGFPAMVAAADAMLKSADVTLSAYHQIGAGLCTAIVRGTVSNVAAAIESGMAEAERVGELHSVMVIPRPLDDLERAMPLAECWLQELQPVRMPINIREPERELQPLPPLEIPETVPVELPAAAVQEPMEQVMPLPMEFEELLVESEAKVEERSADSLDD